MVCFKLAVLKSSWARGGLLAVVIGGGLSACASVAPMPEGLASVANSSVPPAPHRAVSQASAGARYKLGAPYQAGGVWYVPAEQPHYDEVGLASWYGDQFNGKPTANGELFDMNIPSAAHATLPMPSIVEVTNLENGKTIQVRLNDRGPFHPGRIIDMSRGAAQQLGFYNKGTAQVRVRYVGPAPLKQIEAPVFTANRMESLSPMRPIIPTPTVPEAQPASTAIRSELGYAIQAGAFSDRANAERAAARLASAGRTAVLPVDRNGSRLYRVTVGSWASAEAASAARAQVASLGFAEARVVAGS
jgi:rare lipoprotein A